MRRRRRLLYLVGLVPSLLLIGLSGRIAVLLYEEDRAMSAYADGDHERAREGFAANRVLNPIERWVAPFGEGTARFRLEDYPGAIKDLEVALVRVPDEHECIVRVNLALSHEALGDSVVEDDQAEAAEAWQEARDVLQPCKELAEALEAELREEQERDERKRDREDREDGEDPTTEELEERSRVTAVRVDERIARKLGVDEPPDTRRPDEAPPEDEMTREQRERLREKNKKALEENVEHKDDFDFDPPSESPSPAQPSPTPNW